MESARRNQSVPHPRGSGTLLASAKITQNSSAYHTIQLPSVDERSPANKRTATFRLDLKPLVSTSRVSRSKVVVTQIMGEMVGSAKIRRLPQTKSQKQLTLPRLPTVIQKPRNSTRLLSFNSTEDKTDYSLKLILERTKHIHREELMNPVAGCIEPATRSLIRSISAQRIAPSMEEIQAGASMKPKKTRKRRHRFVPRLEWRFADNVYGGAERPALEKMKHDMMARLPEVARISPVKLRPFPKLK